MKIIELQYCLVSTVIGSAPRVIGEFLAARSSDILLITARSAEGNVRELTPSQLETDMKSTKYVVGYKAMYA
jgi:hypothetical protein